MPTKIKVGGTYQNVDDAFVKVAGVWVPASKAFTRQSSVWQTAFIADDVQPPAPTITVEISNNNYITVGVRLAAEAHNTNVKRIRVLVSTTGYPSNYSNTDSYYSQSAVVNGIEPFSDFFYNGNLKDAAGNSVPDGRTTDAFVYKKFTTNMPYVSGGKLKANTRYYFSAWTESITGNWSEVSTVSTKTGSSSTSTDEFTYGRVVVPAWSSGTLDQVANSFALGDGYVGVSPSRQAFFNYGLIIEEILHTEDVITSARVLLFRETDSHGPASAKTYAYRHDIHGIRDGAFVDSNDFHEGNYLINDGTVSTNSTAKGQAVWKKLPSAWYNNFHSSFRGFIISTAPDDTVNTQQRLSSIQDQPRAGTIDITYKVA